VKIRLYKNEEEISFEEFWFYSTRFIAMAAILYLVASYTPNNDLGMLICLLVASLLGWLIGSSYKKKFNG